MNKENQKKDQQFDLLKEKKSNKEILLHFLVYSASTPLSLCVVNSDVTNESWSKGLTRLPIYLFFFFFDYFFPQLIQKSKMHHLWTN